MADREQQTPKPGVEHKPQRGTATRTSGSKGEEQTHGVKDRGSPGRDTADQSKEKNTKLQWRPATRSRASIAARSASRARCRRPKEPRCAGLFCIGREIETRCRVGWLTPPQHYPEVTCTLAL